ncbi:MAG: hypothetical protein ACKPKO_36090, partial [Candidatus Fonsibacter sp.]
MVYEVLGVAIGGAMSSFIVALVLAVRAQAWLLNSVAHKELGFSFTESVDRSSQWSRSVDDIICFSNHFCGTCLVQFIKATR